jgi:hypothetical protein
MTSDRFYNDESRALQEEFDTVRLADRMLEVNIRPRLTDDDRAFIGRQRLFFLATTDRAGFPDCSYKGGDPGFVRVLDDRSLAFPSYDGNGMFKSLGNVRANPAVGMLFIDFEQPRRLRVNGTATVRSDDPLMAQYPGAQLLVRVTVRQVFNNCPRYLPRMALVEHSPFVPRAGVTAPTPEWKLRPQYNDALPERDPARKSRDA